MDLRYTNTFPTDCVYRLCFEVAANAFVQIIRRISVVAMLLPAEASRGVLVARQDNESGNITTVTAVSDAPHGC